MKTKKILYYLFLAVTILCLAAGTYCLVLSIMGKGSWALTSALGLIALGNFLNFVFNKYIRS